MEGLLLFPFCNSTLSKLFHLLVQSTNGYDSQYWARNSILDLHESGQDVQELEQGDSRAGRVCIPPADVISCRVNVLHHNTSPLVPMNARPSSQEILK